MSLYLEGDASDGEGELEQQPSSLDSDTVKDNDEEENSHDGEKMNTSNSAGQWSVTSSLPLVKVKNDGPGAGMYVEGSDEESEEEDSKEEDDPLEVQRRGSALDGGGRVVDSGAYLDGDEEGDAEDTTLASASEAAGSEGGNYVMGDGDDEDICDGDREDPDQEQEQGGAYVVDYGEDDDDKEEGQERTESGATAEEKRVQQAPGNKESSASTTESEGGQNYMEGDEDDHDSNQDEEGEDGSYQENHANYTEGDVAPSSPQVQKGADQVGDTPLQRVVSNLVKGEGGVKEEKLISVILSERLKQRQVRHQRIVTKLWILKVWRVNEDYGIAGKQGGKEEGVEELEQGD
tara:strand:+ start:841 stop:1884 length:1044 start_codon:yes stop_codon:yes gene_type:complete